MNTLHKRHLILATLMLLFVAVGAQQLFAADKPWIGIYMQDVTKDLADAFDLSAKSGVVINDVAEKSPAEKAGLKPKDVILAWNGKTLKGSEELTELVGASKVGDDVKLTVNRGGKDLDVNVTIGEKKESVYSFYGDSPRGGTFKKYAEAFKTTGIGVSLQSLSGKLGEYFGVPDGEGALITDVMEGTPAEKSGLKVGDVIVQVDKDAVETPSDVSTIIGDKAKGDKVDLTIVRNKAKQTVTLEVDEIDGFGAVHTPEMLMEYFNKGNQGGRTPMQWFQYDSNNDENQQKMEQLQKKLEEMQRKLEQLESRMK
jgi:S1-C subfamily serine protease